MKNIKAMIFDVDGTLTDGKIYIGEKGELFKAFDVRDGFAIHNMLPQYAIVPVIITGRRSSIVERRCEELGITMCFQGCQDKVGILKEVSADLDILPNAQGVYEEIAYIGDDLPDVPAMEFCGIKGCPCDAVAEVKAKANYVCEHAGGNGAVREFIEWVCRKCEL